MANFLTQKVGPIPLWGYGLGAAGITLVILLSSKNKAAPAAKKPAAAATPQTNAQAGSGTAGGNLTGYSDLANSFAGQLVGMVNTPQKSTVSQGLPGPAGVVGPVGPVGPAGPTAPTPAPKVTVVAINGVQFPLNPDPMPTQVPAQLWQTMPPWPGVEGINATSARWWVYWGGGHPYLYADFAAYTGIGGQIAPPSIQQVMTIVSGPA